MLDLFSLSSKSVIPSLTLVNLVLNSLLNNIFASATAVIEGIGIWFVD